MSEQEVTIAEALEHIKKWLETGEKEKAEQGLKEILEFQPENQEAKKLLENLSLPSAGMSSTVEQKRMEFSGSSRKKIIMTVSALIGLITIGYIVFASINMQKTNSIENSEKVRRR